MTTDATGAGDAVVVPAITAGSSLTCHRSLGRAGVSTIAATATGTEPVLRSKYCDETIRVPSPSDDLSGYADALLDAAARPDVLTIVPLREPDIYALSTRYEEFAERVATPWKSYDAIETVQDRRELFELAEAVGVPVPETHTFDEWDWSSWGDEAVIKSRYSILVANGRAEYPGVEFVTAGSRPDRDRVVEEMGHVPIVQEYVPGDAEHGFFALFDEGEPIATFQHRRVRSYTYAGGASVFRTAVAIPELAAEGMKLLRELDWHGPAMVEFKRDPRDGAFKLMEINPRFWGSLPLAVHAGVDFPRLYYRLARGEDVEPVEDYDVGTGCHVLRGELIYLYNLLFDRYEHVDRPPVPGEIAKLVGSLYTHPNFDYLSTDDPWPFLADVVSSAKLAVPGLRP